MTDVKRYWELSSPDEMLDHIVENWESDENLDVQDALHTYFDKARPRNWCDIAHQTMNITNRMFKDVIEYESPAYAVIAGGIAASAAGVWDSVAEAFGLKTHYVELVLANWYERDVTKTEKLAPITWEEFMKRYEAEKAEWEQGDVK